MCESCKKFCNLKYGHKGNCLCENPKFHKCNKNCILSDANGCNKECIEVYGHPGKHFCSTSPQNHICKFNCILCENDVGCGHVYNHEKRNNLKCSGCKGKICKLSGKKHLCGSYHKCKEKCENDGFCDIISYVKSEEQIDKKFKTKSGDTIDYKLIRCQELKRKECKVEIPPNELSHLGKEHSCKSPKHYCGFQCKQCEYFCNNLYGHKDVHKCYHGNIKNSSIYISDATSKNPFAIINKDNRNYRLTEGEKAEIFTCDDYCKQQGQGHIHFYESDKEINSNEVKLERKNMYNFLYKCNCSYFWKNILKFDGDFNKREEEIFNLCDWKCKYSTHEIPEYCQLKLWHKPVVQIPKKTRGKWVFNGHLFKCNHPKGIYSIILIDSSGSMSSKSQKPTNLGILEKMPNIMGAALQSIDTYCKIRAEKSPKDRYALFGFNNKVIEVFQNLAIQECNIILEKCYEKLKPKGYTNFKCAFKKAFNLISFPNLDRDEFIPVIILLTDGLDHENEGTLPFVEQVIIYIII